MAQAPTDTRLASLGLLLGAGMIAYSYWHSRTGVGPLSAPGAAGSGQGTPVATGKSLADLDLWASTHGLRLMSDAPGNYVVVPQPGWQFGSGDISRLLQGAGFQPTEVGGQTHVVMPGQGGQ